MMLWKSKQCLLH